LDNVIETLEIKLKIDNCKNLFTYLL